MKITAVAKFKQGDIWEALKKAGWKQADLARKTGLSQQVIAQIVNLRFRPTEKTANRIQKAFAEAGVFLDVLSAWPEGFKGFGTVSTLPYVEQTREVPLDHILEAQMASQPLLEIHRQEMSDAIDEALEMIPASSAEAIERVILDGEMQASVAKEKNVRDGTVAHKISRGMWMLRCSNKARNVLSECIPAKGEWLE